MKKLCLFLTAVMVAVMFSSCKDPAQLEVLSDGSLSDSANGIVYTAAPMNLEVDKVADEPYGESDLSEYYEIDGLDPEMWLWGKLGGYVYCADPTVASLDIVGFEPDKLIVCKGDTVVTGISIIEDANDIAQIVDACVNGAPVERNSSDNRLLLKFSSAKYPGLYFALDFYRADSGVDYAFNRETGEARDLGTVMNKYIPRG